MVLQSQPQEQMRNTVPLWSLSHSAADVNPHIMYNVMTDNLGEIQAAIHNHHLLHNVMDDDTGIMRNYRQLITNKDTRETWLLSMCKELGRLSQGYKGHTEGTNTINFMDIDQIRQIPKDRTITYARIVVDYRPQKQDPFRVRVTVGGNLLNVPGDLSTPTADLITTKLLWNSVISTPGAKYACIDIKNMYLQTPMDCKEYMRIPINLIPPDFIEEYQLR